MQVEKLLGAPGEDSKGKPPAKGAKAPVASAVGEESKPISGEAWLDLTPF